MAKSHLFMLLVVVGNIELSGEFPDKSIQNFEKNINSYQFIFEEYY